MKVGHGAKKFENRWCGYKYTALPAHVIVLYMYNDTSPTLLVLLYTTVDIVSSTHVGITTDALTIELQVKPRSTHTICSMKCIAAFSRLLVCWKRH